MTQEQSASLRLHVLVLAVWVWAIVASLRVGALEQRVTDVTQRADATKNQLDFVDYWLQREEQSRLENHIAINDRLEALERAE